MKKLNKVLVPVLLEIVGLLFEIADYSLHQLSKVPGEISCTSCPRQWGVPGEKYTSKSPIMQTVVKKLPTKRGVSSTLYDPEKHKLFESKD